MSPRGQSSNTGNSASSPRNASAPYSRRPAGQPKSSRQQFSACGACRMRRVRCDLKDLPVDTAGPNPSCSNCKERGLKCVDEFADVKAVKLLRRGRRLQQVEQIYGKVSDSDHSNGSPSSLSPTSRQRIIPDLQPEFFASQFWRLFSTQRPVFDPNEFPTRVFAHAKGTQTLGPEGHILAMTLTVWAYSFGVNERGVEDGDELDLIPMSASVSEFSTTPAPNHGRNTRRASINIPPERDQMHSLKNRELFIERRRRERREKTEAMLKELLELVDMHAIMRRPTWDGVRVLLLLLPLMEEANLIDRLTMYEAALSQSHALCTLSPSSGPSHFSHVPDDTLVRARLFWYAHVQEGVAHGLRGGRLIFDDDDIDSFQNAYPSLVLSFGPGSPTFPTPTSDSPFPSSTQPIMHHSHHRGSSPHSSSHLFSLPLHLSAVCRRTQTILTGSNARRRHERGGGIDADGLRRVWEGLDNCWDEFEAMRNAGPITDEGVDIDRFVSNWQIFIFECHNIIRETLKQRMMSSSRHNSPHPMFASNSPPPRPSSHSSAASAPSSYSAPHNLHAIATHKCFRLLPLILRIIKSHISRVDGSLFKWDTGLVRDGCFFAGFLAAGGEVDVLDSGEGRAFKQEDDGVMKIANSDEAVELCLRALGEMRWAFSKSEEREGTIRMIWENRKLKQHGQQYASARGPLPLEMEATFHRQQQSYAYGGKYLHHGNPHHNQYTSHPLASISDRPLLPPLSLSPRRLVDSAPNTACSTDGSAPGWPTYTPPGTGTSATTSTSTGLSGSDSPVFVNLPGPGLHTFKADSATDDGFYHVTTDIENQFSFNPPAIGHGILGEPASLAGVTPYHHRPSSHHSHSINGDTGPGYLEATYLTAGPSVMGHPGGEAVSQFGDSFY